VKEKPEKTRQAGEPGSGAKQRASVATWGIFQKVKDFLARIGGKKIPGSERVYVFLKRNLRPKGTVLIESHGNRMYADTRDEGVLPLLQAGGIYEEFETELFKGLLKPGMVVVDVGANIGHYSLIAARLVGESGHVYSFEPDPHNFELLRANIELNGFENVTPVNKALSNEPGTLTLYLDKYNLGGHSMSADNVLIGAGTVEVETTSLDLFFISNGGGDRVDVIKMDTQGAEGKIIEGGRRLFEENDLTILMELWPFGLRNAGYDPATLIVNLDRLGFSFRVIEKTGDEAREMDAAGVIEMCANLTESGEHVDLFLKK
jgi:FkbM family methyltransferase